MKRKDPPPSTSSGSSSSSSLIPSPCQKGSAPTPCQKGSAPTPCQKGSAPAPCQKGAAAPDMAPVPCQKELPKWVCVDWFQTIQCHELEWQTAGLKRMKDLGIKIWVVSFAGYFQGQRVQDKCERLKQQGLVDHCSIVSERTGESGKVRMKTTEISVMRPDMLAWRSTRSPRTPSLDGPTWMKQWMPFCTSMAFESIHCFIALDKRAEVLTKGFSAILCQKEMACSKKP